MNNEKAIALAKKLKALADRGEAGEAKNASKLLAKLLEQHNIDFDDLEKEERHRCEYDIMIKHQDLFWAIVFNVVQNYDGRYWTKPGHKRIIILELTYAEQLELTYKFDVYVRDYDRQVELFQRAFIHSNEIYPNRTPDFDSKKVATKADISEEDYLTMMQLMNSIKPTNIRKALPDT